MNASRLEMKAAQNGGETSPQQRWMALIVIMCLSAPSSSSFRPNKLQTFVIFWRHATRVEVVIHQTWNRSTGNKAACGAPSIHCYNQHKLLEMH